MKKNVIIFFIACISAATSCGGSKSKRGQRKINVNDATTIVTETDTNFLGNRVEDIAKNNTSTKQEVQQVIAKVDSVKTIQAVEKAMDENGAGTNIECKGFVAHLSILLGQNGGKYITNKASDINGNQIRITGIDNVVVEQRIFARVQATIAGTIYLLNDLPENAGAWQTIAASNGAYPSNQLSTAAYRTVTTREIQLSVDRELRKAGKQRLELEAGQKAVASVKAATDVPCSVLPTAVYYKISGTRDGKKVQDVIKINLQ